MIHFHVNERMLVVAIMLHDQKGIVIETVAHKAREAISRSFHLQVEGSLCRLGENAWAARLQVTTVCQEAEE